ncbi:uncharacterized protein BYT42DRAFT_188549 [Radiomyces spectabilis]|uniref:uncharacterized protein n=1 Tax=Radiomyces spectabilis TaxID=64574 RepID=UPI00221F62CA|nr:uncharacterized protein BYT42DRAFT_188549 [Radiomyces spectabilis]KAI8391277.1 hypothetical protein BYT42DRAFT_188549 [Radiomyces spectabilis]
MTNNNQCAGWLSKLTSNPTGGSRWQLRYCILSNTEFQCYENEHAEAPLCTLYLRDICEVLVVPTSTRSFYFRFEPLYQLQVNQSQQWAIQCHSEVEMREWVSAIRFRVQQLRTSKNSSMPLLHRRGKLLEPISTQPMDRALSSSASTAVSSSSSILRSPMDVNQPTGYSLGKSSDNEDDRLWSPTFLMYKERFRL